MRKVMWEWTVRAHAFDQQIVAAAEGGFDVLTLPYRNFGREQAAGKDALTLAKMARDKGVALDFVDGMSGWSPIRYPSDADDFLKAALDFGPDEAFRLCEQAGLQRIVAIAGFAKGDLPVSQLVDAFGAFCDRAATNGIWVDLEPMPMMGLPRLADAWEIVRQANRSNSGVLLDTWHFMRGDPDFALLESIPKGKIANVQIVDGLEKPPTENLWDDAMHNREFPGLGALPITRILEILRKTQNLESVGPEALSDRVDALSPAENGRQAATTLAAALKAAGFKI